MKRFFLLPFTVVLAAVITTSLMIAFAFLGDGMQRRARLRSFTQIETRRTAAMRPLPTAATRT